MIADYKSNINTYNSMYKYYIGNHDVMLTHIDNKCNLPVVQNFVRKFITEETNYSLGNALTYVSKGGNTDNINVIQDNLYHWGENHNADVMTQLEIYGTVYLLNYIDNKGRFCEQIVTPREAIAHLDDNNAVDRFIRFYKKKYDTAEWHDIYYPDGRIEVYKGNILQKIDKFTFKNIPVSVCCMPDIHDTIYFKIKSLQDAYNLIESTQICTIADLRQAYLVIKGAEVDDEVEQALQHNSLMSLPSNGSAEWLVKSLDSTTIKDALDYLKYGMYVVCNHIDGNENLPSNTSGVALRSRLVFLEQIAKNIYHLVQDAIYDRIERLYEYLNLKSNTDKHNVKDIKINFTPNVPQDVTSTVQMIVQLGDILSHETKLSLLPFVENPQEEIEKIKAEKAKNQDVNVSELAELLQNVGVVNE